MGFSLFLSFTQLLKMNQRLNFKKSNNTFNAKPFGTIGNTNKKGHLKRPLFIKKKPQSVFATCSFIMEILLWWLKKATTNNNYKIFPSPL